MDATGAGNGGNNLCSGYLTMEKGKDLQRPVGYLCQEWDAMEHPGTDLASRQAPQQLAVISGGGLSIVCGMPTICCRRFAIRVLPNACRDTALICRRGSGGGCCFV